MNDIDSMKHAQNGRPARQKTHHRLKKGRAEKMDLWHMDLIEPVRPATKGVKNCILTIVDEDLFLWHCAKRVRQKMN